MAYTFRERDDSITDTPDVEMNEFAHKHKSGASHAHHEDHKGGAGQYIKSIIYGGLDGIVSVFVTDLDVFTKLMYQVAAVSGSQMSVGLVLVLGLAKLIAGGISMGVGDWLSTEAEVDLAKSERKREEWEVDNYIEGEVEEMVQLYVKKGVDEASARKIMQILSKHRKAFVDIMMAEELGISPDAADEKPWKHGVVFYNCDNSNQTKINFGSFMGFGVVPLIVYVIIVGVKSYVDVASNTVFGISIGVTAATLIGMGIMKGKLTGSSIVKSAITTIGLGGLTAFLGWFIGFILDYAFPGVNIE